MPGHLLIAEDDPGVLAGLAGVARAAGWTTSEVSSGADALRSARVEQPDVCLLDLELSGAGGAPILPQLVALDEAPSVVVLTGLADVPTAVAAMRDGAADFLEKPVRKEVLQGVLERVLRNRSVLRERDRLREEITQLRSGPVVGSSAALRRLLELVGRVAATPRTTVLITGESGVGKELVARAVHERSARASFPFIGLNCAALAETLLEAELFGYVAGAFTGGSPKGHSGLIAAAERGTLFLDEVGELASPLQAKLLRVLQERTYRRVGGDADLEMDVRIIASTNRDLGAMVTEGRFREDLFYRLNVMSLKVPPLRERAQDVPELASHFLQTFGEEFGKAFSGFSDAAMQRLLGYAWPGNVRELRNTIERAALLCGGGAVRPEHLGLGEGTAPGLASTPARDRDTLPIGDRSLRAVEEALIRRVLAEAEGNRSRSAQILGINRTTLYNKLRAYQIDPNLPR
jgi:two-component system response regulator HydG